MSDLFAMTDKSADDKLAFAVENSIDSLEEADQPWHQGVFKGPGLGVMRQFAKVADTAGIALASTLGQGMDIAGAAGANLDAMTFDENGKQTNAQVTADTKYQDAIFSTAEEVSGNAVDYWTPRANEVGRVGQVLGGLGEVAAGLVAGLGTPYALVATSTTQGGKELIDQGVDAGTAGTAAALEGAISYAGLKVPIAGSTLPTRVATGAIGNVALGTGSRAAEKALLESKGYTDQAAAFTTDLASVSTDALVGALFGVTVHTLSPRINPNLNPSQVDAILAARNAKSFQEGTAPGKADDIRANAASQDAAADTLERLSRGEPTDVGATVAKHEGASFTPDGKIEESARLAKMVDDNAPDELGNIPRVDVPHAEIDALQIDEQVRTGIRDAYVKAAEVKPGFDRRVREISEEIGTPHDPLIPEKLKAVDRATEKIVTEYKGLASEIKDLVRATVVVDDLAQAMAAIESATKKLGKPTKLRNTLDPLIETKDGYRDVNMNFKIDGHTVELQANVPEMVAAKLANEGLYHERREIQAKYSDGADVSLEDAYRIRSLDDEMKTHYAAAWEGALSRMKSASEISVPSSVATLSENLRPSGISGTSQARIRTAPSGVGTAETGTPPTSQKIESIPNRDIADSSSGILTEPGQAAKPLSKGLESPQMEALRQLALSRPDGMVYAGYDADGAPIKSTIAAEYERIQREYERDMEDTKAYHAAVTCFMGHGG